MNSKVNWYFEKSKKWGKELEKLRKIALSCKLTEQLKWGVPCYTLPSADGKEESNIVLIHEFKAYCAFLFFKGALLKDTHGILIQQTKNVQAARQVRFADSSEITEMESILKGYIKQAIQIERAGLKVELKKTTEFDMPEEFRIRLDEIPALNKAFIALTPGRQRGYLLYFSSAKQSKTREARIEKYVPQILKGKGLED
jgi:uncharacterized protein YdeI (YjbR/CyaY-like superfamily)